MNYTLGIDIGTTSVKVVIFDPNTNQLIAKQSKDTQANVPSDQGSEGNKQDAPKIASALHSCMSRLPKDPLKSVTKIGICGQMHGVVLWHHSPEIPAWETNSSKIEVKRENLSNLYTWQDSRCDKSFLESLPKPDSHVALATGFGCATLFWFAKNRPEKLERFNCSGTIQDFIVAVLCNLEKPLMTTQNAASWGYYNTTSESWNTEILQNAGFPVHLLPKTVKPGTSAGRLQITWFGIQAGTPIGAALGDFQCSVLATLNGTKQAAINISTSAQVAYKMDNNFQPTNETNSNFIPYFGDTYLAVGASLNGGNVLATFVKMLQQWTMDLGFNVPQSKVWEKLAELGAKETANSTLQINPTLLGERHDPEQNASVHNLDPGNLALGQIFRALCKGIIQNLHSMISNEQLKAAEIEKIMGSGSALIRNKVLQQQIAEFYKLPIELIAGRGACVGAAIAMN